jgi:[ribosomal protein S5]-alanine N-acetyltransferase
VKIDCHLCTIRRWQWGDEKALIAAANNPKIARQLRDRFPHPYTVADAEAWLAYATTSTTNTEYAIEVDGIAIGSIGLTPGKDIERLTAEVGYWLREESWGRGIATAALVGFSNWLFTEWEFLRLEAKVFAGNSGSRRVLEKAGYQLEGILRRSVIKNGLILDQALYARLKMATDVA